MRRRPIMGKSVLSLMTMAATKSGNLLTGTVDFTSAPGSSSSIRPLQLATVVVGDEEAAASHGLRPTTGGHQLQNGHAFGGRGVGASVWRQSGHAGILDADL